MDTKKLYHFLMENECHLFRANGKIKAWVCVNFRDLDDFIEILGVNFFDESGLEVTMFHDYLAVTIDDLIDGYGEELNEYKECFDKSEWEDYFE